jgi:hypothetical protein
MLQWNPISNDIYGAMEDYKTVAFNTWKERKDTLRLIITLM